MVTIDHDKINLVVATHLLNTATACPKYNVRYLNIRTRSYEVRVLIAFTRSNTNLDAALNEFHQNLSSEQKIEFESTTNQVPTAEAVLLLTDEINKRSSARKSHVLAGRMLVVLEAVQQYSAIGDTASSAHPIAALVWSSIKLVVQVMALSVFCIAIINI